MIGASLAGILAAAGAGPKGIQYVGGTTGSTLGTTSSWTMSLASLTGGVASAPAAEDFVVVFYGVGSSGESAALSLSVTGYTQRALLFSNDTRETHLLVATKLLTGADTSITLSQTFDTTYAGAAVVHVFRGVDPTTPLDVAIQTTTALNAIEPDPPSITPTTAGAWVVAGGAFVSAGDAAPTLSSSDLTGFQTVFSDIFPGEDVNVGAGYIANASGAVNPAQLTFSGVVSTFNSSAAATLALRPAP